MRSTGRPSQRLPRSPSPRRYPPNRLSRRCRFLSRRWCRIRRSRSSRPCQGRSRPSCRRRIPRRPRQLCRSPRRRSPSSSTRSAGRSRSRAPPGVRTSVARACARRRARAGQDLRLAGPLGRVRSVSALAALLRARRRGQPRPLAGGPRPRRQEPPAVLGDRSQRARGRLPLEAGVLAAHRVGGGGEGEASPGRRRGERRRGRRGQAGWSELHAPCLPAAEASRGGPARRHSVCGDEPGAQDRPALAP